MVPNYELKFKARAALRDNWQIALMVALIASLPSLASQVVAIMTQSGTVQTLNSLMSTMQQNATVNDVMLLLEESGITAGKYMPSVLVGIVSALLSPFLTLGMLNYFFKLLRSEEDALIGTVFSRKDCFFKAIGLNLMIFLRILLWMLPGWALSLLGAVIMVFEANIGVLVMIAAMGVMLAGMIRAMYRYRLSSYVLADAPETGINAAIRRSKEIMKGRKMELFSLEVSFVGWHLAVSLAQMLLLTLLGSVLGMALGMFASFLLQLYVYMATAAFYQEYGVGPLPEAAPEQEELL